MSCKRCVHLKSLLGFFTFLLSCLVASTALAQDKPKIEITEPVVAEAQDAIKIAPMHDGMSTFHVRNEMRIVRNHEVRNELLPTPGRSISKSKFYDQSAGCGTTTLIIDEKTREVKRDFVSLSGTLVNCCGGATPWGSWISCEETMIGQTVRTDAKGKKTGGFDKPHGYCFEVPAFADEIVEPIALTAMGRFSHEAATRGT